jgi:uncharacterized protein
MGREIILKIRKAVEEDPNKNYIKSVSLFGSFLHGDNRPESDIDLILEPGRSMGFFKLVEIQLNLEKKLGRKVDLVTKNSISKYFRDRVLKEAVKVYDRP